MGDQSIFQEEPEGDAEGDKVEDIEGGINTTVDSHFRGGGNKGLLLRMVAVAPKYHRHYFL